MCVRAHDQWCWKNSDHLLWDWAQLREASSRAKALEGLLVGAEICFHPSIFMPSLPPPPSASLSLVLLFAFLWTFLNLLGLRRRCDGFSVSGSKWWRICRRRRVWRSLSYCFSSSDIITVTFSVWSWLLAFISPPSRFGEEPKISGFGRFSFSPAAPGASTRISGTPRGLLVRFCNLNYTWSDFKESTRRERWTGLLNKRGTDLKRGDFSKKIGLVPPKTLRRTKAIHPFSFRL